MRIKAICSAFPTISAVTFSQTMFVKQTLALLAIAVSINLIGLPNAHVWAQKEGDRVVVTANYDTKIFKDVVGHVFEGDIYTLKERNGNWCRLDSIEGWLPAQNLMSLDSGLRHFTSRIEDNEKDEIAFAHRGMIFHELENYNDALNDLNNSLGLNQKNPVTWMLRGMVLKAQDRNKLAADDMKQAIELIEKKTKMASEMASVLEEKPETEDKKPALQVDPKKFGKFYFNLGLVYYADNDFKKAIQYYNKAIELNDEIALWFVSRGSAHLAMDDIKAATADYKKSLELDPGLADAWIGLSNIALVEEDFDEALVAANKAVELQPKNAMGLNARGWIQYKRDAIDEALYDLNRAIRFAPRLSIAYGNRGVCHVSQNNFEQAISDHSRHLKLNPTSPFALSNRAVAYLGQGDFKKAKEDYEAAVKLNPDLDESLNGYAWFLATCPDEKFRDGKKAVELAKKAVKISGGKDWYHLDTLATAYAETGEFDKAVEFAQKAIDVAPKNKRELCQQQLKRFQNKKPFRSQIGKNAEANILGS